MSAFALAGLPTEPRASTEGLQNVLLECLNHVSAFTATIVGHMFEQLALERICFACGGSSPVSPGIHDAANARRLSDTD